MKSFNIDQIDFSKGLVPAIIQDSKTKVVLMMGYMDREALTATLESNYVTFFSRSRQQIWKKGETSGNTLRLVDVKLDCDADTLLITARPKGPVCHTGNDTCWGEKNEKSSKELVFLKELERIIEKRLSQKKDGNSKSYVSGLARKGTHKIAQKVGEEAVELVIESGRDDDGLFLEEAADLLFHYLVLLQDRGYSIKDVLEILSSRHKKKR